MPRGITLNVNAPAGPLKGLKWCKQGDSRYTDEYIERLDPMKRPYYWVTGRMEILDKGEQVDIKVLNNGYGSITPIQYDLTAYRVLNAMKSMDV